MDSSDLTKFKRNRVASNSHNEQKSTRPANKITQMSSSLLMGLAVGSRKVVNGNTTIFPNCAGPTCSQDLVGYTPGGEEILEPPPPPAIPAWHVDTIQGISNFLPQQAAVDSLGNIYVTGFDPNPLPPLQTASRIYKIPVGGGTPIPWFTYDINPLPNGLGDFKSSGLVIDSSDNLYTAYYDPTYNNSSPIYNIFIVRIFTTGPLSGQRDINGQTYISTDYQGPFYMAINFGDIYFTAKNAVYKTTTNLTPLPLTPPLSPTNITMIAGTSGVAGFIDGLGNTGPIPGPARFKFPRGIVFSQGYLFVADSGNSAIRSIETTSPYNVLTIAGQFPTTAIASNVYNTTYALARFNQAWGIGIEQQGLPSPSFYIGDTLNNQIKKMSLGIVTLFAGVVGVPNTTDPAPAGDLDGLAPNAEFYEPISILVVPVLSAPGFPKIYVSNRDTSQSGVGSDNNFRLISYY